MHGKGACVAGGGGCMAGTGGGGHACQERRPLQRTEHIQLECVLVNR